MEPTPDPTEVRKEASMPARRRLTLWAGLALAFSIATATAVYTFKVRRGPDARIVKTFDAKSPFSSLTAALRDGDARALVALSEKIESKPDAPPPAAFTDAEAADWVESIKALRAGFVPLGSHGRITALRIVGNVMQRFSTEPAAACWIETLPPTHDLLSAGMADNNLDVRVTALVELSKLWSWMPGRGLVRADEEMLDEWKSGFYEPVMRRLSDREAKSRGAAVACLGTLPLRKIAVAAIPHLNDKDSDVRKQVLISFAGRPRLLTEDAILKHMYDNGSGIPEVAETVLKTRGLNEDQISLGSMIFHPKPEMRNSVFALLKGRTDIDPVVWLLQLSHDEDESVRLGAVDALSQQLSPEVGQRIAEMAATDKSPTVRSAATKFLPEVMKTASLPPLPASPGLYPKAN
jgi:HEAT repeat protein